MKQFVGMFWMMMLLCLSSCIDEYNVLPRGADLKRLVVNGQVISGSDCYFSLSHTIPLSDSLLTVKPVSNASIIVMEQLDEKLTDNDYYQMTAYPYQKLQPFEYYVGIEDRKTPGLYRVSVGWLRPDVKYVVRISHPDYGTFFSTAQSPIDAPAIESLNYEGGKGNSTVTVQVSTSPMSSHTCLMWDYEEYWEIYTPKVAIWQYDRQTHSFGFVTEYTNHGWACNLQNLPIVGNNDNYGQGQITRMSLYDRHRDDVRFMNEYCVRVRQMAISEEEYEYRKLVEQQSMHMGGLFTPMPGELPSNLVGEDGEQAIGYVGIRGLTGFAELYIDRNEVGCTLYYFAEAVPDSLVTTPEIMSISYRVLEYTPGLNKAKWIEPWAVDCRDPFWNASLEKPYFWRNPDEQSY